MEGYQALCNSCGAQLVPSEQQHEGYGYAHTLICEWCRRRWRDLLETGFHPVMQWENGGSDGFRLASRTDIPLRNPLVVMMQLTRNGAIRVTHTITGKQQILAGASSDDLVLVAWPGSRRHDMFIVDDKRAALKALEPVAK